MKTKKIKSKGKWIIVLLFSILAVGCLDKKACDIYNNNLALVKDGIEGKKGVDFRRVSDALDFFENLTGVKSTANVNYVGRFKPGKDDYRNWAAWYEKNKNRLYLDEKDGKVKLH